MDKTTFDFDKETRPGFEPQVLPAIEPDYEPLTEQEEAGILAASLAKATGGARSERTVARRGRGRRGGRIFAIAIAAVLAFGAVAFASTVIDPDSPLLAFFGGSGGKLGDEETRLAQDSGTIIDKTIEKDGLKVHVKEAIGDKDTVYLLFDVTLPKELIEPGAEYSFEQMFLNPKHASAWSSTGWSTTYGKLSEDGTLPFIMSANSDGGVQGKTFTLRLENLKRVLAADLAKIEANAGSTPPESAGEEGDGISVTNEGDGIVVKDEDGALLYEGEGSGGSATDDGNGVVVKDANGAIVYTEGDSAEPGAATGESDAATGEDDDPYKTILEGRWEITFDFDYKDNSTDLDIEADVKVDGDAYRLKDVRVSPVSLSFALIGEKAAVTDADTGFLLDNVERDLPIVIKLKDGSRYDLAEEREAGSSGSMISDGPTYKFNTQFARIIDPSQIESISFGNYEAKL